MTEASGGGSPVVAEEAVVAVGAGTMALHVARPGAGAGPWPAVIVGFEMFGVTDSMRRTAARLAAAGLVAVVPDFYHRTAPGFAGTADEAGRAEGYALLGRLDRQEVLDDLRAVLGHLRRRPDTTGRTGMAGFSLGGHLAYFAASQVPLAAAAVVYPGWLDTAGTALSAPGPLLDLTPGIAGQGARVLYLAGADDHVVSAEQTRLTGEALDAAGVRHEIVVYPDTPHGFLADERDTFRPGPAEDAWRRIGALLADELTGPGARPKALSRPES